MKKIAFILVALATLFGCEKDDDPVAGEATPTLADRTVLVYISGETTLWDCISTDLQQMRTGSLQIGNNNLLVYVDGIKSGELPWLARIDKGKMTDSVDVVDILKTMGITPSKSFAGDDPYSSDPKVMEGVLKYAFSKYPSKNNDYALTFWGHGSGWLMKDSIAYDDTTRAYGVDNGKNNESTNGKWINIPTMARVLSKIPHLTYIFFDCCNMMCLENAYELRNVADYIIGSPAEIPDVGAPYNLVVPAMFEKTTFWQSIVDRYSEQIIGKLGVALSAVKTSEMENLAMATKDALKTIESKFGGDYPDMSDVIFYYYSNSARQQYYDANDFILKFAEPDDYSTWKKALDKAVVYKKMATEWKIDMMDWYYYYGRFFTITEEKYSGVSMFVPQDRTSFSDNVHIKKMGWYYAAGYGDIGW